MSCWDVDHVINGVGAGRADSSLHADRRHAEFPEREGGDAVQVSGLDTVYLRRENGELMPYIDIPFEVFSLSTN
ncbi:MAG: hypothetical protein R3B96_21510 [Pirellulaceae bacterium]